MGSDHDFKSCIWKHEVFSTMNLRMQRRITKNKLLSHLFHVKTYFDVSRHVFGWVTTLGPDIVSIGFILWWLGFEPSKEQVFYASPFIFFGLVIFGYFWRHSGFYTVETVTQARINPVQEKILKAAEIIISNEEKKKNV